VKNSKLVPTIDLSHRVGFLMYGPLWFWFWEEDLRCG